MTTRLRLAPILALLASTACRPAAAPTPASAASLPSPRPEALLEMEVEGAAPAAMEGRVLEWFARRDGALPDGEREEEVKALLRGVAPARRQREGDDRKDAPAARSAGLAMESSFTQTAPSPRPPAEAPADEDERQEEPLGAMGRMDALEPAPSLAPRFAAAREEGFDAARLDQMALGLALHDDILAAACVGVGPLAPPAPWSEAWHTVAEGSWGGAVGADGMPLLASVLMDVVEPPAVAELVVLFDQVPLYAQRARRQGPFCLLVSSASPFAMAEEALRRHDTDANGRLSKNEVAEAMAPLAPLDKSTEENPK